MFSSLNSKVENNIEKRDVSVNAHNFVTKKLAQQNKLNNKATEFVMKHQNILMKQSDGFGWTTTTHTFLKKIGRDTISNVIHNHCRTICKA